MFMGSLSDHLAACMFFVCDDLPKSDALETRAILMGFM